MAMPTLILASASPRRKQLLALTGWDFEVHPVTANETPLADEPPETFVRRMSETKAQLAAAQLAVTALIIASDTTVVLDGQILNKPADAAEAAEMLTRLRARTHEVLTAITLLNTATQKQHTEVVVSRVPMRNYSDAQLTTYVVTGDPLDKAGAYAIQHPNFQPVERERFVDCFANVMGLPLCHLLRQLRQMGIDSVTDLPTACQKFIAYQCSVYPSILNG